MLWTKPFLGTTNRWTSYHSIKTCPPFNQNTSGTSWQPSLLFSGSCGPCKGCLLGDPWWHFHIGVPDLSFRPLLYIKEPLWAVCTAPTSTRILPNSFDIRNIHHQLASCMMPASGRELMAQLEEPAIGCCWLGLGLVIGDWVTLWWTNIAIENGHLSWIFTLKMVIFHCYVSSPERRVCSTCCPQRGHDYHHLQL